MAVAFALRTAILIGQEWHEPNYAMPGWVVAVTAVCVVVTIVGAFLASRGPEGGVGRESWAT
ncbi:MAG: hypothetical protein ACYCYK_12125 [Candidatus Dormibacteria bacterium]